MADTTTVEVDLAGRVIVITGAGQGLGRAYAVRTASCGGRVVVNDIDAVAAEETAAVIRQAGGQAAVHVGLVEDPATGPQLVEVARSQFGGLDGAILNAGVLDVKSPADFTTQEMRRMIEVNVLGTMFCAVPALATMIEQGHGTILLVTSGARFGMPGLSAYGASKGAVASLVWGWASEAGPHGVRVNAISPLALTAMLAQNPLVSGGPAPERIAPAAVYLVSAENPLNGEIVRFDGDSLSIHLQQGSAMTDPISREHWSTTDVANAIQETLATRSLGDPL